jgi:hypothetical protein
MSTSSPPRSAGRRTALAVIACLLGFVPLADAQGPAAGLVQKAAREWLALTDANDSAASHKAAGERFRGAVTVAQWAHSLKAARVPLGPLGQRTLLSTKFEKSFAGVPDGEYALLQYRTVFAKKSEARETITLERERDGEWRVIGYFIR